MVKQIFITFAKYNEESDKALVAILDKLSNEDREKNRRSYYGSLSGLARHILGGTTYLLSLFKDDVSQNAKALKVLKSLGKIEIPKAKKLDEAGWKTVTAGIKAADKGFVEFISALDEKDFEAPLKLDWYKGKPATVPFSFMFQQLVVHNTHHRGQISQILDSLKIDNDYSGLSPKFI
jgi:uncharacterized damage-inducible protein DinB